MTNATATLSLKLMATAGWGALALALGVSSAAAQTAPVTPQAADAAPAALQDPDKAPAETADVQDPDKAPAETADVQDIIVTGTLLRGIAPTGSNVVGLTRDDIIASGASSGTSLLATIPQVSNSFNAIPASGAALGNSSNKPVLRSLGSSTGSTTLVLLDGRRLVGNSGAVFDPSLLPPVIIERLEIVLDGGSSLYGSDAIGGVINFITRRKVDGVEYSANLGGADSYKSADASLLAGKSWGTGSVMVAGSYVWHTNISGLDRDYVHANNAPFGGTDRRITNCTPGTITASGVSYALPGRTPGINLCDDAKTVDIYPEERRQSLFGTFTQDIASNLQFNATALYSHRDTTQLGLTDSRGSGMGFSGTINSTNPYFQPIGAETTQNIASSLATALGSTRRGTATNNTWQASPSLRWTLGKGWQVRAEGTYGEGRNLIHAGDQNAVAITNALAGTTRATALNPYDTTQTDPSVLRTIEDFENLYNYRQSITNGRITADGALFALPGGDIRVAVGGEYYRETLKNISSSGTREAPVQLVQVNTARRVNSVFGELNIPIFGAGNSMSMFHALTLNGSVRYDDYNDVGATTNGKIGFDYKPAEQLRIRANWSTSFHAPALADSTGASDTRAQVLPVSPFSPPGTPFPNFFRRTVLLAGGNPALRPETAKNWSVGADWQPTFIEGLKLSGTYWNIRFKDAILTTPFFSSQFFVNPAFSQFYTLNPTQAQAQVLLAGQRLDGVTAISDLYANGASPFAIIQARRNNLGAVNIDGLDFNANYNRSTGFGSISGSFGGTYLLNRKTQTAPGGGFFDDLTAGTARLSFVGTLGARVGDLTSRLAVNHSGSYPVIGVLGQTRVKSFTTADLFFSYNLPGEKNSSFNVTIRNVFNQDPPYIDNINGYTNGGTLGRYIQIGFTGRF